MPWTVFFDALAGLLVVAAAPCRGDDADSRYVRIPVEGTLANLFRERLQAAKAECAL